jgi:hypothetical protein
MDWDGELERLERKRTHIRHRPQLDINSVAAMLRPHRLAPRLNKIDVSCRSGVNARRERAYKVGKTDTQR